MGQMRSHRRMIILIAAAASLVPGGHVLAQPGAGPVALAETKSPFLGKWELDLTRMPDTYGPAPKRVIYAFTDMGAGEWQTTIDITAPDDSVRHTAIRYRRDGTMARSEGDQTDGDSAALGSPAANVLVMSVAKERNPASVRVYAVSPDGKAMTESAAGVNAEGTPFVRNFHFKRID